MQLLRKFRVLQTFYRYDFLCRQKLCSENLIKRALPQQFIKLIKLKGVFVSVLVLCLLLLALYAIVQVVEDVASIEVFVVGEGAVVLVPLVVPYLLW